MGRGWYAYMGGGAPKQSAGSYTHVGKPFECIGSATICVIYAYYVGSGGPQIFPSPPLTPGILRYIMDSNVSSVPLPDGAGNKKYLYLKDA